MLLQHWGNKSQAPKSYIFIAHLFPFYYFKGWLCEKIKMNVLLQQTSQLFT